MKMKTFVFGLWSACSVGLSQNKAPTLNTQPPQTQKPISFVYGFDFDFLADNLEESDPFWETRTLISTRVFPEVGISFFGQNLKVGGYVLFDMGKIIPTQGGVTLSYDFKTQEFRGYFGTFAKMHRIGKYPLLFARKDFDFYHPLIHGAMLQYQSQEDAKYPIKSELIFDWYGGNLKDRIDEFLVQGSFAQSFWKDRFFLGASFLLYHTKNDVFLNRDGRNFDTYLLDRFYYQAYLGSDLTSFVQPLDHLSFQIGTLSSLERKRRLSTGLDRFSNQLGWQFEGNLSFKGFGINHLIYWGDKQYKYFKQYGDDFYAGLPFYQNNLYNQTEVFYEYKTSYLTARVSFILHFIPKKIAHQQMITISVDSQKLLSLF